MEKTIRKSRASRTGRIPVYTDPVGDGNRYPGVQSFEDTETGRQLFRGREKEVQALFHLLLSEPLVVIFGRSGFGKTSLIKAGLLEPLRKEGFFPIIARVNDAQDGPFKTLYDGIAEAGRSSDVEYVPGNTASMWHFFKTVEFWRDDELLTPVLVIDQFEELFTLQEAGRRAEFVDQLADVVRGTRPRSLRHGNPDPNGEEKRATSVDDSLSDRPPEIKIVLSLREDFLADLSELASRIPKVLQARFRLGPLSRENARAAIIEPSQLENPKLTPPFEWSPDALERVLSFLCQKRDSDNKMAKGDEVEPFQLQLVCHHIERNVLPLFAEEQRARRIEGTDVGSADALSHLLKEFYQESVAIAASKAHGSFDGSITQGTLIRTYRTRRRLRILIEQGLISPAGRRVPREESQIREDYKIGAKTLGDLVDSRLLRKEPRDGGRYYELSHDTLIAPILETLRRSQAIKRRWSWGLLTAALIIGTSAWFMTAPDRKATRIIRLAEDAFYVDNDPAAAALLLKNVERTHSDDWARIVGDVLARPMPTRAFYGHERGIRSATFAQKGDTLVVIAASMDGSARMWNALTGQVMGSITGHQGVVRQAALDPTGAFFATASTGVSKVTAADSSVKFLGDTNVVIRSLVFANTPMGARLLTASDDGTARILSSAGNPLGDPLEHGEAVFGTAFNPDGSRFATATRSGLVQVWDTETQSLVDQTSALDSRLKSMAFNFRGDRLLLVSRGDRAQLWQPNGPSLNDPRNLLGRVATASLAPQAVLASLNTQFQRDAQDAVVTLGTSGNIQIVGRDGRDVLEFPFIANHFGDGKPVAAAFHPTMQGTTRMGNRVAMVTAWSGGSVRVWTTDVFTGDRNAFHELRHPGLTVAVFSPNGLHLLTTSRDGSVRLWDIDKFDDPAIVTLEYKVDGGAIGPDSLAGHPETAISSDRGVVSETLTSADQQWRLRTDSNEFGDLIAVAQQKEGGDWVLRGQQTVQTTQLSPTQNMALITTGPPGAATALLWHLTNNSIDTLGDPYSVNDADFDRSGTLVVLGSWDGAAVIDVNSQVQVGRLHVGDDQVETVAFSPISDQILTTTASTAQLWTAVEGESEAGNRYSVERSQRFALTQDVREAWFTDAGNVVVMDKDSVSHLWLTSPDSLTRVLREATAGSCLSVEVRERALEENATEAEAKQKECIAEQTRTAGANNK